MLKTGEECYTDYTGYAFNVHELQDVFTRMFSVPHSLTPAPLEHLYEARIFLAED